MPFLYYILLLLSDDNLIGSHLYNQKNKKYLMTILNSHHSSIPYLIFFHRNSFIWIYSTLYSEHFVSIFNLHIGSFIFLFSAIHGFLDSDYQYGLYSYLSYLQQSSYIPILCIFTIISHSLFHVPYAKRKLISKDIQFY